jgi:hypothetical protein
MPSGMCGASPDAVRQSGGVSQSRVMLPAVVRAYLGQLARTQSAVQLADKHLPTPAVSARRCIDHTALYAALRFVTVLCDAVTNPWSLEGRQAMTARQ